MRRSTLGRSGVEITELALRGRRPSATSSPRSRPSRRRPRSTPPGTRASATSTPLRTTASASPSAGSAKPCAAGPVTRTPSPPRSGRLLEPCRRGRRRPAPTASPYPPRTGASGTSAPTAYAAAWRPAWTGSASTGSTSSTSTTRTTTPSRPSGEGYPALEKLRAEGVVGAIGAGMNQAEMLTRFVRDTDVDAVLCAGRYTLLDQSALAELLPRPQARGTSVVVGGAFNSGLLADPTPGRHVRLHGRTRPSCWTAPCALKAVADRHGSHRCAPPHCLLARPSGRRRRPGRHTLRATKSGTRPTSSPRPCRPPSGRSCGPRGSCRPTPPLPEDGGAR